MRKELETASVAVPEAQQPYRIPDNWRWATLGAINRYCPHTIDPATQPDAHFELYSVPSVEIDYPEIIPGSEIGSTKQAVQKNDILLCKINPRINRVWKVSKHTDYQLLASSEWIVIRNSQMNPDFMLYYFRSPMFREFMLSHVAGVGGSLMRAQSKYVKQYPVPLPPLAEQQRIVDRIESLFTKLDAAQDKAREVIESLFFIRQAYLYHAFMGKLTQIWRVQRQIGFPWKNETLQSVCSMKITDGTHQTPTYCKENQGIPFLSAKDVTSGKICWDGIKYITPELHKELYARLAPQIDDILLAKNGTTGVGAIVDVEKVFDLYVTLAVLRPNKEVILPRYLLNVVNSPICKKQFDEHLTGIGLPNLHLRDIRKVTIPLPSLEEQAEIVRIVDDLTEKSQSVQTAAEQVIKHIDIMKKAILGRAFRGELGTNDPSEASPDI